MFNIIIDLIIISAALSLFLTSFNLNAFLSRFDDPPRKTCYTKIRPEVNTAAAFKIGSKYYVASVKAHQTEINIRIAWCLSCLYDSYRDYDLITDNYLHTMVNEYNKHTGTLLKYTTPESMLDTYIYLRQCEKERRMGK